MVMNQLPKVIINVKLSQVASYLGDPIIGEDINLDGYNLTNRDIEADSVISYCATEKYFHQAQKNSKVKALIIPPNLYNILSDEDKNNFSLIVVEEPEWAFYSAFIDTAKKLCLKSRDSLHSFLLQLYLFLPSPLASFQIIFARYHS